MHQPRPYRRPNRLALQSQGRLLDLFERLNTSVRFTLVQPQGPDVIDISRKPRFKVNTTMARFNPYLNAAYFAFDVVSVFESGMSYATWTHLNNPANVANNLNNITSVSDVNAYETDLSLG